MMKMMISTLSVLGLIWGSCVEANAKAKLTVGVKPAVQKMSKYKTSGDLYPLNGPVIRVYSKDGKSYDRIANDNENLTYLVDVWASCNRKIRSFSLAINGAAKNVKHTSSKGKKVKKRMEKLKTPFTLPAISRTPVKACRKELEKRVSLGHKSRSAWMVSGFVVKYDNAYEAKVTGSCSAALGKGDFEVEKTALPVWIICEAVKGGQKPKPSKPNTGGSGSSPQIPSQIPSQSATTPKLMLSLKVAPKVAQKCPVGLKFTGKISSNRPGVIKYRIVGKDAPKAWQTPVKTVKFTKAGTKTLSSWTHSYHKPDMSGGLALKTPGVPTAIKGSARIVILQKPKGAKVMGGGVKYQIWCEGKPKRKAPVPRATRQN
ncbi:MAG: hypothetical protein COB54_08815 [Alphaproteobacteria bacterium]|nr:MAG: hypothetical protein COB54_08815 [Alphaproteobacteria bacterium]